VADEIAYNNHDIDDGLKSGYVSEEDLSAVAIWKEAHAEWCGDGPGRIQALEVSCCVVHHRLAGGRRGGDHASGTRELRIETFADVVSHNVVIVRTARL